MGDPNIIAICVHKILSLGIVFTGSSLHIFALCFSIDIDFAQAKTPHNKWIAFENHWNH